MKAKYITSNKWQKLTLKGVICTHFYLMETERHKQKLTKTAEVKYQEKLWNCLTSTGKHGGRDSALRINKHYRTNSLSSPIQPQNLYHGQSLIAQMNSANSRHKSRKTESTLVHFGCLWMNWSDGWLQNRQLKSPKEMECDEGSCSTKKTFHKVQKLLAKLKCVLGEKKHATVTPVLKFPTILRI